MAEITFDILTCDGCGVCCMHMSSPPYLPDELPGLPANVAADLEAARVTRKLQWEANKVDAIPCGFFDMVTRRCRHYEHRPEVCQDFEVGEDACLSMRKGAGL